MYLVCGGTNVGKSTFLTSQVAKELIYDIDNLRIGMFYQLNDTNKINFDIIHYNILRMAEKNLDNYDYKFEESFIEILEKNDINHIFILVTSLSTIFDRMNGRKYIEENFSNLNIYNSVLWKNVYTKIDIKKLYVKFIELIKKYNISYSVLDSTNLEYKLIENEIELYRLLEK